MDLRTGTPLWTTLSPRSITAEPLDRDEACDVLIIGSGITGAMAAYQLIDAGLDVVVIDRRDLAAGSTPASTALVQYETDAPLIELAKHIGTAQAEQVYRLTRGVLDELAAIVQRAHIDCDLALRPTLYLASDARDADFLYSEFEARRAIGLEVSYIAGRTLNTDYRLAREAAIRSEVSYELDPWKLTQGLLRHVRARGARLYSHTELPEPPDCTRLQPVATSTGHRISFRHVLFASGYETPAQFATVQSRTRFKSTYALATARLDLSQTWPDRALLWEHASPYFYARTTPDGRLLIGGEDEPFVNPRRRDALIAPKCERLLHKLYMLTGVRIETIDHAWAGTFAETKDSLPLIGAAPGSPHSLLALGYGGNGFTFSVLAAQILRDLVMGQANKFASLFDIDRPSLT